MNASVWAVVDPLNETPVEPSEVGPTGAETVSDWIDFALCKRHLAQAPQPVRDAAVLVPAEADDWCIPCDVSATHPRGVHR